MANAVISTINDADPAQGQTLTTSGSGRTADVQVVSDSLRVDIQVASIVGSAQFVVECWDPSVTVPLPGPLAVSAAGSYSIPIGAKKFRNLHLRWILAPGTTISFSFQWVAT